MSIITRSIFKRLNESESVKKPYGDKPQEGKKEKLERIKKASIPKSKDTPKYKVEKLNNVNKQALPAYKNDTDKYMDNVDKTEHSDKGKIANRNTKKAERKIKFPYGDKVQKSDSKLVKESARNRKSKRLKEAESITKGNQPGAVEFEGYANIIKSIINEAFGGLENVDIDINDEDYHATGNDEMDSYGMDVTIKPKNEIPGESGTSFWIGVDTLPFGAPGSAYKDDTAYLMLFAGDESEESGEPCVEGSFMRTSPINDIKKLFRAYLYADDDFLGVIKKAKDLNDIANYRNSNEITDSAKPKKLKEGTKCKKCGKKVCECDKKLTESDATPDFLTEFKNLLNKYCRVSLKDIELSNDTNTATLVFDNGYRKDINITADSNLAVMEDILKYLASD